MLKKAAFALTGLALLWFAVTGVVSASPNEQAEVTPFEYLVSVLVNARGSGEFSDALNETLADYFIDELIPSTTGETPEQVRERLKARLYPNHMPIAFKVLRAALTYANESGALTDEFSSLLYDYIVNDLIPSITGETLDQVRERLSDPRRARENAAGFYYSRGQRYSEDGSYEVAIPDLSRAIELDPEHIRLYSERAYAYLQVGDLDRAIADFTWTIEDGYGDVWELHGRGSAYKERGDYDEAIVDFDTAISILSNDAYLYLFRGLAYHMKDEYRRAIIDYNRAVAINPDDPYLHFFRSISLKALGKQNEYEKYFALLKDEYDIELALNLLLPAVPASESQAAAD